MYAHVHFPDGACQPVRHRRLQPDLPQSWNRRQKKSRTNGGFLYLVLHCRLSVLWDPANDDMPHPAARCRRQCGNLRILPAVCILDHCRRSRSHCIKPGTGPSGAGRGPFRPSQLRYGAGRRFKHHPRSDFHFPAEAGNRGRGHRHHAVQRGGDPLLCRPYLSEPERNRHPF